MTLDVPTLVVALLLVQVMASLVLGLLWWRDRGTPGLGEWTLGRVLALFSIILLTNHGILPQPLSILLGQGFLLLALHLAWLGSWAFMGQPKPRRSWPFILLSYEVALATLVVFDVPFFIRAALASLMIGCYMLLTSLALWPLWRDKTYLLGKLLVASFLLTGLVHLGRTPYLLLTRSADALMDDSGQGRMLFLVTFISSLLTGFASVGITTERLNGRLRHLAERDPLTGLRNRRDFFARAGVVLERTRRDDIPLAVLALDLDHFKVVNDTHGHAVGDQALRHAATLLAETLPGDALLARMGGEEFALLLPGLTEAEALDLAEAIRARIAGTSLALEGSPGRILRLSASIGLITIPGRDLPAEATALDHLLHAADQALYAAKADGRNRVVLRKTTIPANPPTPALGGLARQADRE
ncbi:MAG: GGDEF domain-containing protein [Rhodospirillum sp.]|nr:GGDEF domain-containing protein [Rhodospirillum sp.]MCF8489606.1 GGDEF domain-containing protein [Rhodospirillum sp.]MCF8499637.1 GGDEF domain-containing protein [Rhodospirillum sp.]